jgi:type II secretory ATPase GspE/PulE/Tfp pilus assembly ATPase PilB-like protein
LPPDPATVAAGERARQLRTRFVRVAAIILDPQVAGAIPMPVLERNQAVPIGRSGNDLLVAMADPGDLMKVDELRVTNSSVRPVLGLAYEIEAALRGLKEGAAATAGSASAAAAAAAGESLLSSVAGNKLAAAALAEMEREYNPTVDAQNRPTAPTRPRGEGTPSRRVLDHIFETAVAMAATEVRMLPQAERTVVQARVEASLQEISVDPGVPYAELLARLKDDAGCDPRLTGVEQNGQVAFAAGGREYELHARILPGRAAELVQVRIIDAAAMKQRRALERKHAIDETLDALSSPEWPPAGSGIDRAHAKSVVVHDLEQQLAAIKLMFAVMGEAMDRSLRDLVLEPHRGQLRVLARADDGHYEPLMIIPPHGCTPLLHRLHLAAGIDLMGADRSQQGLFVLVRSGLPQEVRVATLPTDIGLCMVLHLWSSHR